MMSNKYINTIMQGGSANIEVEEMDIMSGSMNTQNPWIPFGTVDQKVIDALPQEEKKSFAWKQALSSGLAVGLVVTGGFAYLKREKEAMHTLSDGMRMSEADFIGYEEESFEPVYIVSTDKPSFMEVADENKLEMAGVFAATTGALGWYINNKLMKG
jgi:hypothetical protein